MVVCPNPKCDKKYFKRVEHEDGAVNYVCGACRYETVKYYPESFRVTDNSDRKT